MASLIVSLHKLIIFGKKYPGGQMLCILHSEKFKMNEEVDSFLSEQVSNLLLT